MTPEGPRRYFGIYLAGPVETDGQDAVVTAGVEMIVVSVHRADRSASRVTVICRKCALSWQRDEGQASVPHECRQ